MTKLSPTEALRWNPVRCGPKGTRSLSGATARPFAECCSGPEGLASSETKETAAGITPPLPSLTSAEVTSPPVAFAPFCVRIPQVLLVLKPEIPWLRDRNSCGVVIPFDGGATAQSVWYRNAYRALYIVLASPISQHHY